jgi:alpha-glucoside transport system permease protein
MTASTASPSERQLGPAASLAAAVGRIAVSVLIPLIAFAVLYAGFIFLRDSKAPKVLIAAIAIVWGVGGVALLYVVANWVVLRLPRNYGARIIPYVFVGPAIAVLSWYLLIPTIRSFILSLQDATSSGFVGLDNYAFALTNPDMLTSIRNNLIWLIVGTGLSVCLGLLIAVLVDRSRFGTVAKILIFLPMAISFVGAGVIWRFVYSFQPAGQPQIGLLNAVITSFGFKPQAWLTLPLWNTLFLVIILVWAQTGFAMVVLSAALRGVPDEMLEAARIDGATERQVFFRVVLPTIKGSVITVSTTIAILTLKVYDIVKAMTNGNFGTNVIATQQYDQLFTARDAGKASALAIILLIAVMPVVLYNLRQFQSREGFR